jgi:hypothetical protein
MPRLRALHRRISASLTVAFLLALVAGVVGEFFIELGKEKGWYDKPSARLDAFMNAFSDFVTQTWFLTIVAFLCGLTIGLWADYLMRRREASATLLAIPESSIGAPSPAPGMLDFIIEGMEAVDEITRIFVRSGKDATRMQKAMKRYQFLIGFVQQNMRLRRRVTGAFASKLNNFSSNTREHARQLNDAVSRVRNNHIAFIEAVRIVTVADFEALQRFNRQLTANIDTNATMIATIEGTRDLAVHLMGVSRELNAAGNSFSEAIIQFLSELRTYDEVIEQVNQAAIRKMADAEQVLYDART